MAVQCLPGHAVMSSCCSLYLYTSHYNNVEGLYGTEILVLMLTDRIRDCSQQSSLTAVTQLLLSCNALQAYAFMLELLVSIMHHQSQQQQHQHRVAHLCASIALLRLWVHHTLVVPPCVSTVNHLSELLLSHSPS